MMSAAVLSQAPVARRLATLLALYEAALATLLASDEVPPDTESADAAFAQLRAVQQRDWPEGRLAVERVGLAACDLLQALGTPGPALAEAGEAHAAAVRQVHRRLAAASLECA